MIFSKSLDPDQFQQNAGCNLDLKCSLSKYKAKMGPVARKPGFDAYKCLMVIILTNTSDPDQA